MYYALFVCSCHLPLCTIVCIQKNPTAFILISYCLRTHLLNADILCAYAPFCVGPADYQGGGRRAIFVIGSNMTTVEYSTVNDSIRDGIESFIAELTVNPDVQAMGIVRGMPERATVNIIEDEG